MDPKKVYINRDKSWLQFNARVLQEAEDTSTPLIERIRFLGIHSNNLDEFFRVRYASIRRLSKLKGEFENQKIGGYTAQELISDLTQLVVSQQQRAQVIYENLIEELKDQGIFLINENELTANQKEFVRKFYIEKVSPSI